MAGLQHPVVIRRMESGVSSPERHSRWSGEMDRQRIFPACCDGQSGDEILANGIAMPVAEAFGWQDVRSEGFWTSRSRFLAC